MKTKLLLLCLISVTGFAQINTTTGSGNFFNPFLWDCLCMPENGDTLVINHDMELTGSIYYNIGQIKINSIGSLTEDGSDRDVWVDGTGSLINNGTFDCYRLYVSDGLFQNTSNAVYFDSLWNQGTILNSGMMTVFDIFNDQTGDFTNSGNFVVENNFVNSGVFANEGSGIIDVGKDFSNCNLQTMNAMFINDGVFCISEDFSNCLDDTLAGSGEYYIGMSSLNAGRFEGNFTFNTPTGALSGNSGTVDPAVNFGNAPCYLNLKTDELSFSVYPNPANDFLYVSESNLNYQITDLSGKLISSGITNTFGIDISTFENGIYAISLTDVNGKVSVLKFVKH